MSRIEEFAISAFLIVQVSASKGGRSLPPQKGHPHWVSYPIKTSPVVVPTTRKEAPTGNAPMGATLPKAVINRFPQSGGNRTTGLILHVGTRENLGRGGGWAR